MKKTESISNTKNKSTKKLSKIVCLDSSGIEDAVQAVRDHLVALSKSGAKKATVGASPYFRSKSLEQLAAFHGVILNSFHEADPTYSPSAWKHILKEKFLKRPVVDPDTGEVFFYPGTRKTIEFVPSLSELNIQEMSVFIQNCLNQFFDLYYCEIEINSK